MESELTCFPSIGIYEGFVGFLMSRVPETSDEVIKKAIEAIDKHSGSWNGTEWREARDVGLTNVLFCLRHYDP